MNALFPNPFFYVILSSLVTFILAVLTSRAYPKTEEAGSLPGGISSPTLAFEFIRSQTELDRLFQAPDVNVFIDKMRKGHQIDNFFAGAYPITIVMSVYAASLQKHWGMLYVVLALVIALIVSVSDIRENKILLELTRLNPQTTTAQLNKLNGFVRTKFFTLALLMALLIPFWLDVGYSDLGTYKIIGLLIGTLTIIALPLGIVVAANGRRAAPYLMKLVLLIYLLILIYSFCAL